MLRGGHFGGCEPIAQLGWALRIICDVGRSSRPGFLLLIFHPSLLLKSRFRPRFQRWWYFGYRRYAKACIHLLLIFIGSANLPPRRAAPMIIYYPDRFGHRDFAFMKIRANPERNTEDEYPVV